MPYSTSTNPKSIAILPGSKTYLLGNAQVDGGVFNIVSVAITSNVATVTVTGYSGVLPVVGTPITIRGTSNGAGEFNVTNIPVTAVSLDQTGAGTISFALTGTNLGTTADSGTLSFVPQVVGETAVVGSTIAGALARPSGARGQQAVTVQLTQPSTGVTAVTVTMQVSQDNVNWANLPTSVVLTLTATIGYFETTALFVRGTLSAITGTGALALAVSI